jgi:hypothetical protein
MSHRIDLFCEDLRQKLTIIESGLQGLKAKVEANEVHAERDVRNHLDRVRKRIDQGRTNVCAAKAEVKSWAEDRNSITADKIAQLKTKRDVAKLQGRANKAERYSVAAVKVATAAIDEAEQASLEAWLARADADYAQGKQTASTNPGRNVTPS